ncbi:DUF603 domain-containing protein (plasmid) [Borrelia puertoricensis]|uniref:DUF603 domain-containing protein n=1 Tax=Borrelia puertoricensis TaxID=2756107 RepID=UPI003EBC7002
MNKIKKSLDDYVLYFREGRLNDTGIVKELGVSRINVGNMRCRWEEIKDDPEYINGTAKLTICEDSFKNILFHASQNTAQARDLKSQFSMAKSMLGLKTHNYKIEELESQISNLDKKTLSKKVVSSEEESLELEELKLRLDELKRERELKKISLYYRTMLKLKATDTDVRSRSKLKI